jgi:hypothetical protein
MHRRWLHLPLARLLDQPLDAIARLSVQTNVQDLHAHGLLGVEDGLPREARNRIERLIEQAREGQVEPSTVHQELERWGLFEEYQDRFLSLFRGR